MTTRRGLYAAAGVTFAAFVSLRVGPLPAGLLGPQQHESTVVLDRSGEPLYEARAADGSRAAWLTADQLPQSLVDATLAAEDRRFWWHPGIDPIAMTRAAVRDVRSRRVLEGGSTITQQVAKLLLARLDGRGSRRGVGAKAREAVVALRLEHRLTKRELLALYLNLAPYGNQLIGAERASEAYFGHRASLLTPAEAAFLAALPQRPSSFNPYRDAARARRRQEHVIVQMGLTGALSPDAVVRALDERLSLQHASPAFVAPHFVNRVLASIGPVRPRSVVTTLDAALQRTVQGIVRAERPALDRIGAHNVAVVVLDNLTGEWLAWEGSGDYASEDGGAIDGVSVPRQPGSALKPFTYALAFERGESPATVLPDVPSYFPTGQDGVLYSPRNYDNRFRGPLLARRALAGSENVPAVALASRVGVPELLRFLRDAGFTTFDKTASFYGLGVTLGDAEVRLDELVTGYAALARGGLAVQPRFIRRASNQTGSPGNSPSREARLVSTRTAFWISDILSDDDARSFAFGRGGSLEFPFKVAAKTGTSEGYHDNWAIGYTRAITVGVWVGNFDRRPLMNSSGVSGAGPIFHAVMLAAQERVAGALPHDDLPATAADPVGTVRRRLCALSGSAAAPWCPVQVDEWVAADAAPAPCEWHRVTPRGVLVDWPVEYQAWARTEPALNQVLPTAVTRRLVASGNPPSNAAPRRAALRIANPPDGAVYLIDPTLRREFQTLPLRAVGSGPTDVEWSVDDQRVGQIDIASHIDWPLAPGRHVITARDRNGGQAGVSVTVK